MRIVASLTAGALALTMAAPAAAGGYHGGGHYADGWRGHERYEEHHRYAEYGAVGARHAAPPPCDPRLAWRPHDPYACPPGWGEVRLDDSFFFDAGGVGPAWISGGGGGGGGVVVIAGAGAGASAFASASANVSVRFRGRGFHKPRHGHHGKRHHGGGCGKC